MTDTGPDDSPAGEHEAGRLLFARECSFMRGVATLDQLPPASHAEVAFAGRSNVGKSSLLNALTGRKSLARTSRTPGRTQQLNFFDLGSRLILVDLPGYGWARVPKDVVDAWNRVLRAYLRGRPTLRRVCLLVDSRHGFKQTDREFMDMLDQTAVTYQVVLTKIDKLKADRCDALAGTMARELGRRGAAHPVIARTSAEKRLGIAELRTELARIADPRMAEPEAGRDAGD